MRQIADRAGVSIAAVSMALNKKDGVSKEKADDLRRIAREMGYLPNRRSKSYHDSINLIQPIKSGGHRNDSFAPLIAEFLQALAVEAGNADLGLKIHTQETEDLSDVVTLIEQSGSVGSIVLASGLANPKDAQMLAAVESPIVIVEGFDRGIHADVVSLDNDTVVHDLLFHLYSKGHTAIGLVQDEDYSRNLELREGAFFYYLEQAGLDFGPEWYYRISDVGDGSAQMRDLLKSRNSRPTALLCVNDLIAYQCIHACHDLRISVPEEMAIVGIDDLPASRVVRPQLTTARISRAILARRSIQLLTDRIEMGSTKPPEHVTVGGLIVPRESA